MDDNAATSSVQAPDALLELIDITKAYPGVVANDSVSLRLEQGEILALLGENGAGKSTLMKILFGLVQPDSGQVLLRGQQRHINSPQIARQLGIGMVQQHFALFEGMTVLENIALGLGEKIAMPELREKSLAMANKYGLHIDLDTLVLNLSAGEKQRIEIVRTLLGEPTILVLDEPTSVLTPQEADQLFAALKTLKTEGRGLIFISHKLGEVKALCDNAVVLRGGKMVAQCDPRITSAAAMAEHMLGQRPQMLSREVRDISSEVALCVRGARVMLNEQMARVDALDVSYGEIVGVAGVAGNGQEPLYQLLSGELRCSNAEKFTLFDAAIGELGINARRNNGAVFVPEERLGHAAVPDLSLLENSLLSNLADGQYLQGGRILWHKLNELSTQISTEYDVKHGGLQRAARSLSGGNLQKYVVGRELVKSPRLLVINQPTWGVDMGAAQMIRQEIKNLAATGTAVVVISQDLDELLDMCDSMAVLNEGVLSDKRQVSMWTLETLGLAMTGEVDREN